jgi:hypothetical protein
MLRLRKYAGAPFAYDWVHHTFGSLFLFFNRFNDERLLPAPRHRQSIHCLPDYHFFSAVNAASPGLPH